MFSRSYKNSCQPQLHTVIPAAAAAWHRAHCGCATVGSGVIAVLDAMHHLSTVGRERTRFETVMNEIASGATEEYVRLC